MTTASVTRRYRFAAAHRLHSEQLSEAENWKVFGKCNNPNGHGHNYGLEVTLKGEVDPRTGYVVDLKRVRETVEEVVLRDVDHANLNVDVPWLEGTIPTAENVAIAIWRRLEEVFPGGVLDRVVVSESERNYVEYRGE